MRAAKYRMLYVFSPAIDIRPFVVMYTCARSTSACDCSLFSPVKLHRRQRHRHTSPPTHLNIPIWRVMCPHSPGVWCTSVSSRYSSSRIEMIRCAIVLISRFQSSNNSALLRISAICTVSVSESIAACATHQPRPMRRRITNFAPLQHRQLTLHPITGFLLRRYNMQRPNSLPVQPSVLCKALINCIRNHRPRGENMYLTWHTSIGTFFSTKYLTAHASLSRSPLAKPWYAQSKNA